MDNDFMKHLEHGQVTTPVPTSSQMIRFKGCGVTRHSVCTDTHHHGLHVPNQPGKGLLRHSGRRRWLHRLCPGG